MVILTCRPNARKVETAGFKVQGWAGAVVQLAEYLLGMHKAPVQFPAQNKLDAVMVHVCNPSMRVQRIRNSEWFNHTASSRPAWGT